MQGNHSSHPLLSHADGLAAGISDIVLLVGRILVGWIFVRSGYGKLFTMEAYAATFPARGLPTALVYLAVPTEFFGGLALMFGLATRYVAVVMAIFVVVATVSSHAYWNVSDAAARRAQDSNFYKNTAILGGILFLFVCGAGKISLDNWWRKSGAISGPRP